MARCVIRSNPLVEPRGIGRRVVRPDTDGIEGWWPSQHRNLPTKTWGEAKGCPGGAT